MYNYKGISQDRCKKINTHELLKQELFKQTPDDNNSYKFNNNAISTQPSEVGFYNTELYFDTTQRDRTSDISVGELKWNIPPLNNSFDVKNCIQFHINEFYFPNVFSQVGGPDYFYFKRMFMEIQDAPSNQAILAANGNRFHFEFAIENLTGQSVRLIPIKNSFTLANPLQTLSIFRPRFSIPTMNLNSATFKRVDIPNDIITVTTALLGGVGFNPIRFQITSSDTTAVLGQIGVLVPSVAVSVSNYQSNSALVNSQINNPNGIYVTNIIDATTFEIAGINGNAVNAAFGATIFIFKNRIAFPMRFTSLSDRNTNYVNITQN